MNETTNNRGGKIAMGIITASLLLAVFVCALCDAILNKGFTWSRIVLFACLLAWGVTAPLLLLRKWRVLWSAAAATVLVPALLWVTAGVDPMGADWFPQSALLFAALWLGWMWVPVLLHTFTPISKWFVAAAAVILACPINWYTNALANGWVRTGFEPISMLSFAASSAVLLFLGVVFTIRGRKKA